MTAVDGRHERHMMRQRGAGARSIPTNFGFVFQAGPIQINDTTTITTESPLPASTLPIAIQTEPPNVPAPSSSVQAPAIKRKRLVREEEEEDDQAWFQKRKRKSTKQEENTEHTLLAAPPDFVVDESHQEPPIEKKPAKRKVRKRVLVPRSRKKAPGDPQSEPQKDEPIPLPEPEVEALPPAKKKTKTKTPAVTKRKPKQPDTLDALLPIHEQQDQSSNHSSHTITKPALPNKARSICRSEDGKVDNKRIEKDSEQEPRHDIVAAPVEEQPDQPPKKKKLVRRVRVPKLSTKQAVRTTDNLSAKAAAHTDVPKAPLPTDDIPLDVFEASAPAPITKKASKAHKKIFFDDDSDVDLDQMLSGIAAMAGTKTATKAAISNPSRAIRKKAAS